MRKARQNNSIAKETKLALSRQTVLTVAVKILKTTCGAASGECCMQASKTRCGSRRLGHAGRKNNALTLALSHQTVLTVAVKF
jgi:hypothetical protein